VTRRTHDSSPLLSFNVGIPLIPLICYQLAIAPPRPPRRAAHHPPRRVVHAVPHPGGRAEQAAVPLRCAPGPGRGGPGSEGGGQGVEGAEGDGGEEGEGVGREVEDEDEGHGGGYGWLELCAGLLGVGVVHGSSPNSCASPLWPCFLFMLHAPNDPRTALRPARTLHWVSTTQRLIVTFLRSTRANPARHSTTSSSLSTSK
jgi:hypothetical protein